MDRAALIRERLRRIIEERYGSVGRFAVEAERWPSHVGQVLKGERDPRLSTLLGFAEDLGVDLEYLVRAPQRRESMKELRSWSREGRATGKGARGETVAEREPAGRVGEGGAFPSYGERRQSRRRRAKGRVDEVPDLVVLNWVAHGATNEKMAHYLGTTEDRVEKRRRAVLARLDADAERLRRE